MHQRLAPNIQLLDTLSVVRATQALRNSVAKLRIALKARKNEPFISEIVPINRFFASENVIPRQDDVNALRPQRDDIAADGFDRIRHER
jgi:hypothetical protein